MSELNLLSDGEKFELLASMDRTRFVLRSKTDFYIAHLDGSEAAHFYYDYRTLQRQCPALDPDQALAQLWNEGGYHWYAAQYGD